MNEIYWITRLESINNVLMACVIISVIITGVSALIWILTVNSSYEEDANKTPLSILKKFSPVLVIFTILYVFTPTAKDAMMIWGIGGTIDYIKSNNTAKQLPDKYIQALDKFVDEYMLDTHNNKENAKNQH